MTNALKKSYRSQTEEKREELAQLLNHCFRSFINFFTVSCLQSLSQLAVLYKIDMI